MLLFTFATVLILNSVEGNLYQDLSEFCINNGFNYISLSTMNSEALQNEAMEAFVKMQENGIRSRQLSYEMLNSQLQFNLDTFVLLANRDVFSQHDTFQMFLQRFGIHRIRKSILVLTEILSPNEEDLLRNHLEDLLRQDAHFYMLYQKNANETHYYQVLSLNNSTRTLVQELRFNRMNQFIDEIDMQGVQIISNTLSWAPYFIIENCDEKGQNCDLSGFLADYMDALGRVLNFTWTSHAPPDGSWGVRPISGPFDKTGVWGGAMGGVVNGHFHISLSQWVRTVTEVA